MIMSSIIVAGNGVSLRQMPRDFLQSRPLFGMNYLPCYANLDIDYWTAWDAKCLEDNLSRISKATQVILPTKHEDFLAKKSVRSDFINFVTPGRNFSSSMLWAIYLIDIFMPCNEILVVGFDCTTGNGVYLGKGKGANQHFYDPRGGGTPRYAVSWDKQMAKARDRLAAKGKMLVNISPGSKAKLFPPQDWRNYV